MKHVTYGDKPLLMDDETADCLIAYATALSATGNSDSVTVSALDMSGNEVDAAMLLNSSTALVTETTTARTAAPPNEAAIAYMREKTALLAHPPEVQPTSFDPRLSEPGQQELT